MKNQAEWNPPAAETKEQLADVLFFGASGIKTQVLKSAALSKNPLLKKRLSEIADELYVLQQDALGG